MRISDWSSDVCSSDLRLEVGIFGTVLGRDDEAKLVSVADRALEEFVAIGAVGFRAVELTRQSLARDPVALDVAQVRAGGLSRLPLQPDQAGLHPPPPSAKSGTQVAPGTERPPAGPTADPEPRRTPGRAI